MKTKVKTEHYIYFLQSKMKQYLEDFSNEKMKYENNLLRKLFKLQYTDSRVWFWSKTRWSIVICEDELERLKYEKACNKEETELDNYYNPSFYQWQNNN